MVGLELTEIRREEVLRESIPVLAPLGLAFKRMMGMVERETGLSAPKWFVLVILSRRDGIGQGEVSQLFEVDPSRVTRIAQALEGDGLVRRKRDPEDNRVVRMFLTEEGRRWLRELPDLNRRIEKRIRSVFSEEEHEELQRMLGLLAEAMKE
jgi:MarR family transcriptional regulator, organic hydroperoxide resistance regulator